MMNLPYFDIRYTYDTSRNKVWKAICEYLQDYIPTQATILELGAGYCDFINQIQAKKKYALDINPQVAEYCDRDVAFINSNTSNIALESDSIDIVFASNLLEHLHDKEREALFANLHRVLKKGGRIILIQPNIRYCYREYWDDFTHVKAFSDVSLSDFVVSNNYRIIKMEKKFLPFSLKSNLPKSYLLTKLYLKLFWRPFAKQMLIIAERS